VAHVSHRRQQQQQQQQQGRCWPRGVLGRGMPQLIVIEQGAAWSPLLVVLETHVMHAIVHEQAAPAPALRMSQLGR
jgi:hypothetical protein